MVCSVVAQSTFREQPEVRSVLSSSSLDSWVPIFNLSGSIVPVNSSAFNRLGGFQLDNRLEY